MARLKWRRSVVAGAAIATLALVLAQPAMAYTELSHKGQTGPHTLLDTSSRAGGVCAFEYGSSGTLWELTHIYVNPPQVRAISGMASEKVAWSFTIQRKIGGDGRSRPWTNRYTSRKFTAWTDPGNDASFSPQGVNVIVPYGPGGSLSARYRAKIKMFWYAQNGTDLLGTATGLVDWYSVERGSDTQIFHGSCFDYEL